MWPHSNSRLFSADEVAGWIRYEDDDLLVVEKPDGLATQPARDPDRQSLFELLSRFEQSRMGSKAYIGLHHRLDAATSGLLLFTRRESANVEVSRLFQERKILKLYWAIGEVRLQDSSKLFLFNKFEEGLRWTVDNHLKTLKGKPPRAQEVRAGGDRAITDFRVLQVFSMEGRPLSAMVASPRTGRMHQIRVHLADGGLPVFGDPVYFAKQSHDDVQRPMRMCLHAGVLAWKDSRSARVVQVVSQEPRGFPPLAQWQKFLAEARDMTSENLDNHD